MSFWSLKRAWKCHIQLTLVYTFFLKWERFYTNYKNVILPSSKPSWGVGVVSIVVWATIILLNSKFHFKTYPTQHFEKLCLLFIDVGLLRYCNMLCFDVLFRIKNIHVLYSCLWDLNHHCREVGSIDLVFIISLLPIIWNNCIWL